MTAIDIAPTFSVAAVIELIERAEDSIGRERNSVVAVQVVNGQTRVDRIASVCDAGSPIKVNHRCATATSLTTTGPAPRGLRSREQKQRKQH